MTDLLMWLHAALFISIAVVALAPLVMLVTDIPAVRRWARFEEEEDEDEQI